MFLHKIFVYVDFFSYLCTRIVEMKHRIAILLAILCVVCMANAEHLSWDYSHAAPEMNPDRGLSFSGIVNDPEGEKNGLKGIKLNSSGWCSFEKAPVAGVLKLTFGPRSGMNPASLQVFLCSSNEPQGASLIATTCEVNSLRTLQINLTAEQNNIYITRLRNTETVLQKIEFEEGVFAQVVPCEPLAEAVSMYSADMRLDTMPKETVFFLSELMEANKTGNKTIYLPNGVYDMGALVLTAIEANDISIIGESMDGVIIRNVPDYRYESIDKTATMRICPGVERTYLQNLTIQNGLDYYKNDNGRAVALWDQGTKTVCQNVRLLSYQDTYYSDMAGGVKYFEDCEIHGTVDFICGNGNVYFKNCLLYCEKRSKDGHGTDALTASSATKSDRGYVFEGCTVKSECPAVSLGRSWKRNPKCVFLNTVLDYSAGYFELENKDIQRWTKQGMSVLPEYFGEYNTTDTKGRVVSPKANEVIFTHNGATKMLNTILSGKEAECYTMEYVLGEWAEEAKKSIKNHNQ